MTRFQETVAFGTLLLVVWGALLRYVSQSSTNESVLLHTKLLPFYGLVGFGAVSAFIVLYRVFTFNDCPAANEELQQQIKQAHKDLKQRGFIFPNKKAD